jgi:transcription antitermination factor NusG
MNELDEKINQLDNEIPKWFAIYTKPRMEKTVFEQLKKLKIETYLPIKRELRQWSNRKKYVETPLFSSYIFVKVVPTEYYKIPPIITGFLKFVLIHGNRIAIRDHEIETIKLSLKLNDIEIETTNENFESGENIEITKGILKGKRGQLIDFKGNKRITIKLENLQSNVIVDIDRRYIKKIIEKLED